MRRLLAPAVVLAIAIGLLSAPTASLAAPSSTTADYTTIPVRETGVVTHVYDGDTIGVLPDGASTPIKIRLLGVNTPEVTGFNNVHFDTNMCGGQEALRLLQAVLPIGRRVQLRSNSAESSNRGRLLRYAFAQSPGSGEYDVDLQAIMAGSGLAMWFTLDEEAALSYPYRLIIETAQHDRRGIWNPAYCGPLEQPDAQVSLVVSWDAPGNDSANLNGEYVVVRNTGSTTVDLSDWLLRDSSLTSWFYFPAGTVLAPGDFRVVHVGSGTPGTPDPHELYMGATAPLFPNTTDGQNLGDGAYLLDRNTAIRSSFEYPCMLECSDPLRGRVVISRVNARSTPGTLARRANQEFVTITNRGTTPAQLDGYYLRRKVSTYPILANTSLAPGASLTVRIGMGVPTATTQYWGQSKTLLNDRHDRVELLSGRDVLISEKHW